MIRVIRDRRLYGIVSSSYNEALRTIAKETPGCTWMPANRAWVGYSDAASIVVKRLRSVGETVTGDVDTTNGVATLPIAYEGLRDYQKETVDFAVAHAEEGGLIALDTGLGKSACAIRVVRTFKGKTVVVCPSFVKSVWAKELERWWPKAKFELLATTKAKPISSDLDVVVIHYDVLHAWVTTLIEWGCTDVIFDEAHALMSAATRRTKAATALARACKRRLALTATPMTSRPRDLWALVETISEGRFGSRFFNFGMRYCDGRREQVTPTKVVWKFDGASNIEELNERLKHFMIRRTKADVSIELPPVTDQIIELEVAKGCLISPTAALRSDRIFRQALDLAADGKIPQVIDMVADYIEQKSKVVVFSYRKAIAHAIAEGVLAKLPVKVRVVTGDVHHDKRRAIVDEQPDLLCATMDSLGVGVSLAYADIGLFAELHYVPSVLVQCLDAQTEILTPDGFKQFGKITRGDLITAFDRRTGKIKYRPALSVVHRRLGLKEKMFAAQSNYIDLRVTGGHRMVHSKWNKRGRSWSSWDAIDANELAQRSQKYRVPVAGRCEFPGVDLTDDELRVIGWYLTDGHLSKRGSLSISQAVSSRYIKALEKCIRGAGMRFTVHTVKAGTGSNFVRRSDLRYYHIPKYFSRKHKTTNCGWAKLEPYLHKDLPPSLFDMTREQFAVMLETIHAGNGEKGYSRSWVQRTYHITTGNGLFAERLQHMAIVRGFRSNIATRWSPSNSIVFTINIRDCDFRSIAGASVGGGLTEAPADPNEWVWCAENSLGTLVVRRNGKVAIVGNCRGRLPRPDSKSAKLIVYAIARGTADDLVKKIVLTKILNTKIAIGKDVNGLYEALDKKKDRAEILRALYERIVKEDA